MKYGLSYTLITGLTGFISRTIFYFRRNEVKFIVDYVTKLNNKKVLDYGCNTGYLINTCSKKNYSNQYYGVDINPFALERARNKYSHNTFYNVEDFLNSNEKYDVITCSHVLEHIHDREKVIQQFKDHLNDNGLIILAIPQERIRGDATIFQIIYNLLRFRFENPHVVKINLQQLNELMDTINFKLQDKIYTNYFFPFKSKSLRLDSWSLVAIYKK